MDDGRSIYGQTTNGFIARPLSDKSLLCSVHSNELHLFWAKAFPLREGLLKSICFDAKIGHTDRHTSYYFNIRPYLFYIGRKSGCSVEQFSVEHGGSSSV